MRKLMLFVATATMLFAVSCSKDEEKNTPVASDNQMVYNGKTYQGESSGSVDGSYATLVCFNESNGTIFMIQCNIANPTNYTYDLTRIEPDHELHFHALVQSQDELFDLQYQNAPHLWYFLDGDNVSGSSAFTDGTAVTTLDANTITITVNGTLVNGKPLSFRVVVPLD